MELNFLTNDELKDIKVWVTEKRDHYNSLLRKIELRLNDQTLNDLIDSFTKNKPTKIHADSMEKKLDLTKCSVNELIVYCLKDANKAMSTNELRQAIRMQSKRIVSNNGVRAQLKKDEGIQFERVGTGKYTKWIFIDK